MLMKTLAYFECSTGIAGDMCLGALIHAGVPLAYLRSQLEKLGIQNEFELEAESVLRNQQTATKAHVKLLIQSHSHGARFHHDHSHHDHSHHDHLHDDHSDRSHKHNVHSHKHSSRRLPEIRALIQQADLPKRASQWSLAVFQQLAEAEAAVHGIPPEQVHFHEVGATDAIVDIVGTCLGLDWLKVDELICSPLPTGGGTVRCDHGLLSVPVPAVLAMMTQARVPVYSNGIEKELVTPTGCAIATTLAKSFGPPPRFRLQTIGLGAGGRDLPLPNILRLWIGTTDAEANEKTTESPTEKNRTEPRESTSETVVELQTQIDDCSPQAIGYVYERLFAAGALDVFSQAVAMKKNRLGTLVTVLCSLDAAPACEMILFTETTTLGVRRSVQARTALSREIITVTTQYGEVAIKIARTEDGNIVNVHPEYEDCASVARSRNIPWQQVHQTALSAAHEQLSHKALEPFSSL